MRYVGLIPFKHLRRFAHWQIKTRFVRVVFLLTSLVFPSYGELIRCLICERDCIAGRFYSSWRWSISWEQAVALNPGKNDWDSTALLPKWSTNKVPGCQWSDSQLPKQVSLNTLEALVAMLFTYEIHLFHIQFEDFWNVSFSCENLSLHSQIW